MKVILLLLKKKKKKKRTSQTLKRKMRKPLVEALPMRSHRQESLSLTLSDFLPLFMAFRLVSTVLIQRALGDWSLQPSPREERLSRSS